LFTQNAQQWAFGACVWREVTKIPYCEVTQLQILGNGLFGLWDPISVLSLFKPIFYLNVLVMNTFEKGDGISATFYEEDDTDSLLNMFKL